MNPLDGFEDEIGEHIEREVRENIDRGMTPAEARAAALRKFGNVGRVMEDTRDVWRRAWFEQAIQDVRYGLRFLRRNPRFAAVVILTLALGIGVNTAVFSVVNTVLLKPLAYPDPQSLVWVGNYDPHIKRDMVWMPDFVGWRQQSQSFRAMAAFGYQQAAIQTRQGASQVTGVYAAGDFWKITGARAAMGRLFSPEEQDGVVLSWNLFQHEFGGDSSAIGKPVAINGRQTMVDGVLPPGFSFQFPMWWVAEHPQPVEAYFTPPALSRSQTLGTQVVASLKPGVSIAQAESELKSLEKHLREQGGGPPSPPSLHVDPLQQQLTGGARRGLLILVAAGAFVLLIAIINVANLLLARATLRQREVAVRAAVGAGRARVFRQLLVESLTQALAGGLAGILLARWALYMLVNISPFAVPRLSEASIDGRVLLFTFGISLLTGVLFGAGPAVALWRSDLQEALRSGPRNSGGVGGLRVRRMLVAVELALAIVLLTGAGLMLKNYAHMSAHAPGFDPHDVVVMKVRLTGPKYRDKAAQQAYLRELQDRLNSAPGVRSAGASLWFLFGGVPAYPTDTDPKQTHTIRLNAASTGYLQSIGITLLKGRWLNPGDTEQVLLNQSMAREVFGSADPVGRQFTGARRVTVVGIVSDVKYSRLDAPAPPEMYLPVEQSPIFASFEIAARAVAAPTAAGLALRKLVADIDPTLPVFDLKTLDQALAESIASRRFNLFLLGGFAAVALLLAVVGIYGVTAYSVAERTREIGVRMALGARRAQVAGMVVREALPLALVGIAAGLGAAWSLSRWMASLLYDATATDPATFTMVALVLGGTAVIACLGPALKAASVDPTVALRYE